MRRCWQERVGLPLINVMIISGKQSSLEMESPHQTWPRSPFPQFTDYWYNKHDSRWRPSLHKHKVWSHQPDPESNQTVQMISAVSDRCGCSHTWCRNDGDGVKLLSCRESRRDKRRILQDEDAENRARVQPLTLLRALVYSLILSFTSALSQPEILLWTLQISVKLWILPLMNPERPRTTAER